VSLSRDSAHAIVRDAIVTIVPDADVSGLGPQTRLREAFELDSLDFLGFVELLSSAAGVRIDDDDYPDLITLGSAVDLLVRRAETGAESAKGGPAGQDQRP